MKSRYTEIEKFRFPNKSVFNTFSEFTKERRRIGFEQFLKLVLSQNPPPIEIEEFLELESHKQQINSLSKINKTTITNTFQFEDTNIQKRKNSSKTKLLTDAILRDGKYDSESMAKFWLELPRTILTTYLTTMLVYTACVIFGIIDISTSTLGNKIFSLIFKKKRNNLIILFFIFVFSFFLTTSSYHRSNNINIIFIRNYVYNYSNHFSTT